MVPAALDFTSKSFDPCKALRSKNIFLPYPKAKTYNNIAEYYSQVFLRKGRDSNLPLKTKEVPRERNYDWYYDTLGLTHRQREFIRLNKKIQRRKGKKPISVVTIPCPPLRSGKVLKCQSNFKEYCRRKYSSRRKISSLEDILAEDNETDLTEINPQKYFTESQLQNPLDFEKNEFVSPLKHASSSLDLEFSRAMLKWYTEKAIGSSIMGTDGLSLTRVKLKSEILNSKNSIKPNQIETNEKLSKTTLKCNSDYLRSSTNSSLNTVDENPKDELLDLKKNVSALIKSPKKSSKKRHASLKIHQEKSKIKKSKKIKTENGEKIKIEPDKKIKEKRKKIKTSKSKKFKKSKQTCGKEFLNVSKVSNSVSCKKNQSTLMKDQSKAVLQSCENISNSDKFSLNKIDSKLTDAESSDEKKKCLDNMSSKEQTTLINRCTCNAGLPFGLSNQCTCGYYSTAMEKLRKFKIPRKKKC
ncbi:voltage-dependent calcium channel type A subunit alpha-1 [Trichonephila clavipes]|nr:voltage-dependent calcium channel type A subunit alpha-1 [Trichonephila clavipes]